MWKYFTPEEQQWYRWRLDGSFAYLRKNSKEWQMVFVPGMLDRLVPDAGGPEFAEVPSTESISFAVSQGQSVALRPHFGERPYIILIKNDVHLLPDVEARFKIALSPLFRFELKNGQILGEFLPFILSYTWFGDKTDGTLCFSLPMTWDSLYESKIEGDTYNQNIFSKEMPIFSQCKSLVHCEIVVRNTTKNTVEVKQLALYTDLLNIYEKDGFLLSDTVFIDATADGGLRMSVSSESHHGYSTLHKAPKSGAGELLIRRGVNFLKTITGL